MATFIPVSAEADRALWLLQRRTGLGSSDAAACCGLSRYDTPLGVYADKLGRGRDRSGPELLWGNRMEPVIAQAYRDETGRAAEKPRGMHRCEDAGCEFMLANVDLLAEDGRVVEIKNSRTAEGWGEPGTDLVPEHVLIQCQHQMKVMGAEVADVAVLVGGSDFRLYEVARSDSVIDHLVEIERELWGRVRDRRPPSPDWQHPTTPDLLRMLHTPADHLAGLIATAEQAKWAEEYVRLGNESRDADAARKLLRARLEEAMGDHPRLNLDDGSSIRRKVVQRKGYAVEPTAYIDFRMAKGGGRGGE